ncbi:hypothetical protein BLNAU_23756 [Blattamonas nauphoetae]|uniref:Uncharacterized protein n=1 Tax=Blattamonas nauphoetae TaxID=2049346 RepID=A0ABQ9WQB7_9EUKA|nr:hypothetical protein BLNAU_23756 [Blattamonas nauphoetae]
MDADVHVTTSGSKVWDCGSSLKQCETVTFAGDKVKTNYKVIVAAGEYSSENEDETCTLVNTKIIRIEGAVSSSTSVSFIKPTFFQTANMTVSAGLLSVSAMSLTLINCILKGTGSDQNDGLNIIGGSLAATGCEFNDIHSTLSTGAAIQADFTSTSPLTHSSSSFTNCKLGSESKHVGASLDINLQTNRATDIFISTPILDKESKYCTEDYFKVSWQNNAADNLRFKCFSRAPRSIHR